MANEELEDTTHEEPVDQTDDEQDLPSELPDDPAELKKIAATAIERLTATQRREAVLSSDKERLEDNLEEQRTKANFWAVKAQELETNAKATKPNGKAKAAQPADDNDLDGDMEIADATTAGLKLSDLDKRAEKIAERIAARIVKQTTEDLAKQGQVGRTLATEYPDLNNPDSPLTKEAIAEMGKIEGEMPDSVRFEMATRRAASRLGVAAKTASTNGNGDKSKSEQAERERRRIAQGGPTGKASLGKGAIVITDADRKAFRELNNGQDVPDSVIKAGKQFDAERQQSRAQR